MGSWIFNLLIVVEVVCALAVVILVLLQHGKGADMGAAFGSGASGSLFGASGSANFLSRSTAVVATIFFLATIGLAYTATSLRTGSHAGGIMSRAPADSSAPAPTDGQTSGQTSGQPPAPIGAPPAPGAAPAPQAPGDAGSKGTQSPANDKSSSIPK
jgi:preprotein translocase subunit SecG